VDDVSAARTRTIIGYLRRAAGADAGPGDGQLLGRYIASRDGGAFEALVRRHGPMVLGVCRRVLGHAQDAEDAFQAAFLVLARKAASVAKRESVGAWLHGVAYRAALQARSARGRRRAREQQVEEMPHPLVMPDDDQSDLLGLLDRELARLPERHRLPLVLCELEGRSRKEAARQLGLAEGTLSSRLARGRKMLARRMAAHGAAVTAASLAALLAGSAQAASVPGALVGSTIRAAGGVVPAGVAALAKGVMKAMVLTKLKAAAWGLLLAATLAAGAVALTYRPAAAQTGPATPADRPRAAGTVDRDELEALRLEVEALRLDLKAAKERVKTLEDEARENKPARGAGIGGPFGGFGRGGMAPAPGGFPGEPPPGAPGGLPPGFVAPPGGAPRTGQPGAPPPGIPFVQSQPGAPGAGGAPPGAAPDPNVGEGSPDPTADLEAAVKKFQQHPNDRQALEQLERAVQRLKAQAPDGAKHH